MISEVRIGRPLALKSFALLSVFAIVLACPPRTVNAQTLTSPNADKYSLLETAGLTSEVELKKPSTEGISLIDRPIDSKVETVGHLSIGMNDAGPLTQLSHLQSSLQAQQAQISALQRQLYSGSTGTTGRRESRWFTTYESVVVQPLQQNTTGLIVETDTGYSHIAVPWKLQNSPRFQLGYEVGKDAFGWRVRYWQFRHSKAFHANNANGLLPTGNEGVVGFLSEDGDITVGLDFIEDGRFQSSVRTDVIDWELQRQITDTIDFYGGLRYAKIAQGYGAVTDQGNAWADASFRGLGPTMALRLQRELGLKQLALFANVRGSMLFGHKEFRVVDDANNITQSVGTDDFGLSGDDADTLSANTEMQIGIAYTPFDWWSLSVAFEAQSYLNVGGANPTGVFTGPDSGLAGDSPVDDSLSFAGVTVGSEITW